MLPSIHLLSCVILMGFLFPFFGWSSLIVLLGGFFIDVDHYLIYAYKNKDLSLVRAYNYFKNVSNHDFKNQPLILHFLELTIILIGLSFYSYIAFLLTLGVITHLLLDFIYEVQTKSAYKITKSWSLIFWIKNQEWKINKMRHFL